MNEKLAALAAEVRQLRTELGAFGVNLTENARASLEKVEALVAELSAPAQDKARALLG